MSIEKQSQNITWAHGMNNDEGVEEQRAAWQQGLEVFRVFLATRRKKIRISPYALTQEKSSSEFAEFQLELLLLSRYITQKKL